MKKSKEQSGDSKAPTKRKEELENSNFDIEKKTIYQILKMLNLKQWIATLSVIIPIIAIIFKAGVEYHDYVVSKDEKIQQLINEIIILEKKIDTLSDEKGQLEKDNQRLNNGIENLTKRNNRLNLNLQTAKNELNNLKTEMKHLKEELCRIPPPESVEVTIELIDFEFQTPVFTIFLNDTLIAHDSRNEFKLTAVERRCNLKIQYKDNANRTWEYTDFIDISCSTSEITIKKSRFKLIN